MKNTQYKVEDVSADILDGESITGEEISKPNNFLTRMM